MLKFGTFEAQVKVDGAGLPEYQVEVDEQATRVTCWIASENFSVCWHNPEPTFDTTGHVYLDGAFATGKVLYKGSCRVPVEVDSLYTSPTSCRRFSFSPIVYTDDDTYLQALTKSFGEIEIRLSEVTAVRERGFYGASFTPNDKVHERSKKLGAHCVKLGAEEVATPTTYVSSTIIRQLVTFVFRYRPLDMLQANGIVPAPPRTETIKPNQKDKKRNISELEEIEVNDNSDEDIDSKLNELKAKIQRLESRRSKKQNVGKIKTEKRDNTNLSSEVLDLT
ncbi:hypothetical protein AX17_006608 [Amanita inopinata Kibby_2008]|nr:hypothetical protein AX17_006608 [Amanita inopinata Kibby_2008]